ncbi:transcriptional regulator [Tardiphaga sp. 172_B4_N1_3]|uniref:transcriptional regulator n=1 Tax=Tardiphaga sp. 172_B4_N1_3 TaxID=3240787 RepID=UPI003F8A04F2
MWCYRCGMAKPEHASLETVRRLLFKAAVRFGGSETKLAKAAGYSQNAVWTAKHTGRVSAELAMAIEVASRGDVTARQFRPDLPWPPTNSARIISGPDSRARHEPALVVPVSEGGA